MPYRPANTRTARVTSSPYFFFAARFVSTASTAGISISTTRVTVAGGSPVFLATAFATGFAAFASTPAMSPPVANPPGVATPWSGAPWGASAAGDSTAAASPDSAEAVVPTASLARASSVS